jgi:hypothetical protein
VLCGFRSSHPECTRSLSCAFLELSRGQRGVGAASPLDSVCCKIQRIKYGCLIIKSSKRKPNLKAHFITITNNILGSEGNINTLTDMLHALLIHLHWFSTCAHCRNSVERAHISKTWLLFEISGRCSRLFGLNQHKFQSGLVEKAHFKILGFEHLELALNVGVAVIAG